MFDATASSDGLSLRDRAYRHLQRKILRGEFRSGHVISENAVAKEIGISRTPVREAIRRLEQEGVLKQVPRYGTVVRTLTRQDIVELYELREALEPFAAARAAGQVDEAAQSLLQKLCDQMAEIAKELRESGSEKPDEEQMQRLLSADLGFHMVILRSAGNRRMMKIIGESRLLGGIFGTRRQEHDLRVIEETHAYHTRILEALRLGDGDAASQIMTDHIGASCREALDHFDRVQSEPLANDSTLILPEDVLADLKRLEDSP